METIEGVYGERSKSSTLRHLCIKGGEEIEALNDLDKAIAAIAMVAHTIQIKQRTIYVDLITTMVKHTLFRYWFVYNAIR
ncbi:unnamed protein product [Ilex paraguariensis]|uniref:Uncharacterized protein n=1 Tax=Ilex paraguariensis TaxID=185542 RepID=A0ABC8R4V3_9AQUA